MCNDPCFQCWPFLFVCSLPKSKSDHHPLLLVLQRVDNKPVSPFKFLKMQSGDHNYLGVVKKVCNISVSGCAMFILAQKLRLLKKAMK